MFLNNFEVHLKVDVLPTSVNLSVFFNLAICPLG